MSRDLLADLDPEQRAAVTHEAGRLRVLAAPGSGKTRVLTRRAAWRVREGVAPSRVLVATFTRRAAGELERRLGELGVDGASVGTFHGLAVRQLRQRADDHGRARPRVLTDPVQAIVDVAPDLAPAQRGAVLAEWSWAGARRLDATTYAHAAAAAGRHAVLDAERIAELLDAYATWKRRRGVLDFDDLLAAWVAALRDDPAFGRAQRWRFRELLVDEFQDVHPGQLAVIDTLLDDDTHLTVVGDPDQSIYGWNGADPDLLHQLPARLGDMATVELTTTYRCSEPIAGAAAEVLGRRPPRARSAGPDPELHPFADDDAERAGVIALVTAARARGGEHAEIAVLARTRALASQLADALRRGGVAVADGEGVGPGVTVTTFHAAKGLEWDEVVLAGVEDGLVPHRNARTAQQIEEERRLLYVAMTRAGSRLHVTWTAERRTAAGSVSTGPSPWLGPLRAGQVPSPGEAWQVELRRCREALDLPSTGGVRRRHRAALAWRSELAARARCLPEVVVDDGLLRSLAAEPPSSIDELARRTGWGDAALRRHGVELAQALEVPVS